MRLPIRTRLTLISAAMMAVVLVAAGAFLYFRLRADLLQAVDAGLRSRAEAIVGSLAESESGLGAGGTLIEPDEAFAQVLATNGAIIDSSPGLGGQPLLPPSALSELDRIRFFDSVVPTVEESVPARLFAVPFDGRVVVVGASVEDQRDALGRLAVLLAVGGPVALALATLAGWLVAGAALRPVERMRSEASAISADDSARKLPVPETGDELARLGETLNEMLARLRDALERERRFVGDASHELRTPLANLKAEIELALRRSRTREELLEALRSAGQETDRLVRLAEDLLVLARGDHGQPPAVREPVDVAELVEREVSAFSPRASERGIVIETQVPEGRRILLDPARLRQALGNLLDNAVRHSPSGGTVGVAASMQDGSFLLEVRDAGEGFPAGFLPRAFEPFARADPSRSRTAGGTGLGLAIVRAVAEAHGGTAEARNHPDGGASVVLTIPV
jgi:heavy metal sensor kinase